MSNIIGNIIKVDKFIRPESCLEVKNQLDEAGKGIDILIENRKYVVPEFQREIRWDFERINVFIRDVIYGPKFLGNIILAKNDDIYNIIDGQQRLTTIFIILEYIKNRFDGEFPSITSCAFEIASYKEFNNALRVKFDLNKLETTLKKSTEESDLLRQNTKYMKIYKIIENDLLDTKDKSKRFIENLLKCELNIIIDKSGDYKMGIEYFLDVNTKSLSLDKEDIFKGYLFRECNLDEKIVRLWSKIKRKSVNLNDDLAVLYSSSYDIMKVIEHFFRLILPKKQRYEEVDFNTDFELTKNAMIDSEIHYKGEHIIPALSNVKLMKDMLNFVDSFFDFCTNILSSETPNIYFKNLLKNSDSIVKKTIFAMLRNILLNPIDVPKIILMKYFLILTETNPSTNSTNKIIFQLFPLASSFTIFATRKDTQIYDILVKENYIELSNKKTYSYINMNNKYTSIKLKSKYLNEDDLGSNHLAKTLACLYNFYEWNNSEKKMQLNNIEGLLDFMTNTTSYSVEHLIINNSKSYKTSITSSIDYPIEVLKYRNCMINFIFIEKDLNNSTLQNYELKEKINLLSTHIEKIKCRYSKKMISLIKDVFKDEASEILSNDIIFSDITKINDLLDKLSNELSNHIVREIYKGVHLNDAS